MLAESRDEHDGKSGGTFSLALFFMTLVDLGFNIWVCMHVCMSLRKSVRL